MKPRAKLKISPCSLIPFLLCALLLSLAFNLAVPKAAFAGTDTIEITGEGIGQPLILTREELEKMEQHRELYSSINTWPTKKWYTGQGVKLSYLLGPEQAAMKPEATLLKFTASDGYAVTLTVEELLGEKRFRFPHFKDGADADGHLPGSPEEAVEVEPIIGLLSVEGSDDPNYMNAMNTLVLMLGQRAVTEQTGNLFVKYLSKIEVLTAEPESWDAPQANPEAGRVSPGTMITLSNLHNDEDKIHYTLDGSTPTMDSPIYNRVASRWWSSRADVLGTINHPIGPLNEDTTIKALTIGPGKRESEVVTFRYEVAVSDAGTDPGRPAAAAPGESSGPKDDPGTSPGIDPAGRDLTDIKGHWAEKTIDELVAAGAVSGYPDGTFQPNNTITRAEFAAIIVKAFNLTAKTGGIFDDTAAHWAGEAISTAQAHGIVSGYSETTFGPNDPVTREQVAVMIAKAAGLPGTKLPDSFTDSGLISSWAKEAVAAAAAGGIITGYPDQTFRPQGRATRAEAAAVILSAGSAPGSEAP